MNGPSEKMAICQNKIKFVKSSRQYELNSFRPSESIKDSIKPIKVSLGNKISSSIFSGKTKKDVRKLRETKGRRQQAILSRLAVSHTFINHASSTV